MTEFCGFRARAERTAAIFPGWVSFCAVGLLVLVFLCQALPTNSLTWICIGLVNFTHFTLLTLWDTTPPNQCNTWSYFNCRHLELAEAVVFLGQFSVCSRNPNEQQLTSVCSMPLLEWLQAQLWHKIWIYINLINTTYLNLMSSWDPVPPNW